MQYRFCVFIDKAKRVDMYLSALFWDFSRSYIQKLIDKNRVFLNSKEINKNIKIKNKDEIIIKIEKESLELEAQQMDLDIVYEDENLLVINKNPWINVHPVPWENGKKNTLVNALLYHCKNNLPSIWWVERPWIVHRLDKETSWLIMVAKTDKMMNYLWDTIKNRLIEKYYIAIVYWIVKRKQFKIESYIGRHKTDKIKMTTKNPINPKIAITYCNLLWHIDEKYSVLLVKIETWRTHQIRVHLSSIWFPILWDKVYWDQKVNDFVLKKYSLQRQALHAYRLKLKLYSKDIEFVWDLKEDMKQIIWELNKD